MILNVIPNWSPNGAKCQTDPDMIPQWSQGDTQTHPKKILKRFKNNPKLIPRRSPSKYISNHRFNTSSETYKGGVRSFKTLLGRYAVGFCAASAGKTSPYLAWRSSADDTVTASLGKRYLANHSLSTPSVTIMGGLRCDNAIRRVYAAQNAQKQCRHTIHETMQR